MVNPPVPQVEIFQHLLWGVWCPCPVASSQHRINSLKGLGRRLPQRACPPSTLEQVVERVHIGDNVLPWPGAEATLKVVVEPLMELFQAESFVCKLSLHLSHVVVGVEVQSNKEDVQGNACASANPKCKEKHCKCIV